MQTSAQPKSTLLAWSICGLGAIYYTYEYLLRIAPSVMEPALTAHFNLSATGFGILASMYYYAYVPMQLPVGVLLDRYGPRRLLTIACLICVIGTFMFAGTSVFWVGALARFLVGFGSAFAFVGVMKLATIWLPEDKMAMVAGLAAALGTVGAMLGDNFMGLLVHNIGWEKTTIYSGIAGIVLIFILWYGIRDKKVTKNEHIQVDSFKQSMVDLAIILKNGQIWINGLFGCLVYLPTTVFAELWGIPYLKQAHGLTHEAANFANSLLFLGFTIGAPLMGYISDKLRRRKVPMVIGAVGAASLMMIILYVKELSEGQIDIIMFTLGLFYSSQCIVFAVARELSPSEAGGTAMAITNMIVMLGAMFCQPLVGWLLDLSLQTHKEVQNLYSLSTDVLKKMYTPDDYQFALTIIPIGIIIAGLLTLFLKETHAELYD